jgi:mannose-6-phosphate isomerase-like protein (cupin superfamily)
MQSKPDGSRPWGEYFILSEMPHFKCKRLTVKPGQQLSYQSHEQREEHWVFTSGSGVVVLDEKEFPVKVGMYIKIPKKAKHRIRNTGKTVLELIEVQLGEYFGEDDIVRYQDDYGR